MHVLSTDGGARGNPGPAAGGFVLTDAAGRVVRSGGHFLGVATNNVAEYQALRWGLATALHEGVRSLEVRCDSELVVRQVNGQYKVKNAVLQELHAGVGVLIKRFDAVRVVHVRREQNAAADALANRAMDLGADVGDGIDPDAGAQDTLFP